MANKRLLFVIYGIIAVLALCAFLAGSEATPDQTNLTNSEEASGTGFSNQLVDESSSLTQTDAAPAQDARSDANSAKSEADRAAADAADAGEAAADVAAAAHEAAAASDAGAPSRRQPTEDDLYAPHSN